VERLKEIAKKSGASLCVDCGKCSTVCPVGPLRREYRPRLLVKRASSGDLGILSDRLLWSCLTCMRCEEYCDSGVNFSKFMRELRARAFSEGESGPLSHYGLLQSIMRFQAQPELRQNRLEWLQEGLQVGEDGDYLLFVGCAPYFDVAFEYMDQDTAGIARSAIKLLNHIGITPQLLKDERCCGHDLLWSGETDSFRALAELNIAAIRESGAKTVLTACPECYWALKEDYARHVEEIGVEIKHISQFLHEQAGDLGLTASKRRVTYQDPCRLGRFAGIYDEPREILGAVEGLELVEMGRTREGAFCCGTSGWMNCDRYSKQMQVDRLMEARSTGADCLVVFCPKCQVHFDCAMRDESTPDEAKIEIVNLLSLIADGL